MGYVEEVLKFVHDKNSAQPEFCQAVDEVLTSLGPVLKRHPKYEANSILERLVVPDRIIIFRVSWMDDRGKHQLNRGYRVQFNNALGPYKGGLRFHNTVYMGLLKFLGFEQIFKNALTTLPMGGAKGGSDFDPKGKSDSEVMRFCQAFMTELYRHIGPDTDVPAGDIGVGGREIGYLFGQYKRIVNEFTGSLTGKAFGWGGSQIRPEATGYGVVYFAQDMLATRDETLEGMTCCVSGSGNVAQYCVQGVNQFGGKCVTMSDSDGFVHDADGIDDEKLAFVMDLKNVKRGRISDYCKRFPTAKYYAGRNPWAVPCDCAFPCATQNEVSEKDARALVKNGCTLVAEGANMPSEPGAVEVFLRAGILYGPGKAANAGGVAVSGLEMAQNALHINWSREEVDTRLRGIMQSIHRAAYETAADYGQPHNYVLGANIAGFVKVADAMVDQGIV